jgi:hypothetical protein
MRHKGSSPAQSPQYYFSSKGQKLSSGHILQENGGFFAEMAYFCSPKNGDPFSGHFPQGSISLRQSGAPAGSNDNKLYNAKG